MDLNTPMNSSGINTPPQGVATPPPSNSSKPRFSKKMLIITGAILLVIVIGLVIYFLLPKENLNQINVNQPNENSFPYAVVGNEGIENINIIEEVTTETTSYVDSQKLPDGFYNYVAHYNEQCKEENGQRSCPYEGTQVYELANTWTALARFANSKILNDPNLITSAKEDLQKLEEYCNTVGDECNWVLAQPAIIYKDTQDPDILAFLNKQGEILLASQPSNDPMLAAIEVRELALLYEITNDVRYLNAANSRLLFANNLLNDQPDMYPQNTQVFAQYSCWVALASAQVGVSTNDNQMKGNAATFLANGNIEENFNNFPHPVDIQPCIEAYFLLEDYKTASSLTQKFIEKFYDGKERKLIYGEGGTVFQPNSDLKLVVLSDSSYTAYLLYLLSNI